MVREPELFGSYSPGPLFLCRAHADRFLPTTLFLRRRGSSQESDDLGADGRAEAGARVPTRAGRKCAVISRDDVVERRRSLRGIDLGLDKSSALSVLLIVECDEPRPKWGDGAGATDDQALAIDAHLVTGHGVGVSANVRDTSAASTTRGRRHMGVRLPGRQGEDVAHS